MHSYVCHGQDRDYYQFDVADGQQIDARLTGVPPGANYELDLMSPVNNVVDRSRALATSDERISFVARTAGKYRVEVFGCEGTADPAHAYTLRVDLSSPTPTAEPAIELADYLEQNPRIRGKISLETGAPGKWLSYDDWPYEWQQRLEAMYVDLVIGEHLPLPERIEFDTSEDYIVGVQDLVYASDEVARDVYFAQVAHALHLEIRHLVPWRLSDYSDVELEHLLLSDNFFDAQHVYRRSSSTSEGENQGAEFRYIVCMVGCGARELGRGSESILGDPRVAYDFMLREPEQHKKLLGSTREETAIKVTEWMHDYLWHGKIGDLSWLMTFYRSHPYMRDRLSRLPLVTTGEEVYVAIYGCWSASAIFAELLRAVNIPVKLAQNYLASGGDTQWDSHSGLVFDWQRPTARYLLHTDDIYVPGLVFEDPAPGPGVSRGEALWQHVWLDETAFFKAFSPDADPDHVARASEAQVARYRLYAAWRTVSHISDSYHQAAVDVCRYSRRINMIGLKSLGLSDTEAGELYDWARTAVESYGEGDLTAGCDQVGQRREHWCVRTGKCDD